MISLTRVKNTEYGTREVTVNIQHQNIIKLMNIECQISIGRVAELVIRRCSKFTSMS